MAVTGRIEQNYTCDRRHKELGEKNGALNHTVHSMDGCHGSALTADPNVSICEPGGYVPTNTNHTSKTLVDYWSL
jgi:hypothetical protein